MTRETYELEKIINKKLFSPYSPKYKNYIQNNENKNESENNNNNKNNNNNNNYNNQNENYNEHNNKYFLEKTETYNIIRIMLSQPFNRVFPDVDSLFIISKRKSTEKTNNNGRNRTIFYKSI